MGALMKLNFERCQVYKLNISSCLTEREQFYYNYYCDGASEKKIKKLIGNNECNPSLIAKALDITELQAFDLIEGQFHKDYFKEFLIDEINIFSDDKVREVRESAIYFSDDNGKVTDTERTDNKIVWFENECVRRCDADLSDVPLLDQFLILKCKSEVLKPVLSQVVKSGVMMNGKHYIFYTSSTGQMKDAELTLLEESYWEKNKYTLMCGLTEEEINFKGGINMGKFFSAKALNISNSKDVGIGISIDDVIIVPDFKTYVSGMVNYIDIESLAIDQRKENIPIEHMDGAGIFTPGLLPCSCQIRGGWLKGAIFPFDFHKFIEVYKDNLLEKNLIDAWGDPLSINDFLNAKMILTDSQLKMRKYYDSMEDYRKRFKKSGLSITVNNCAHSVKDEIRVAYQPVQTIPRENLTQDKLKKLTQKTISCINDAKVDPEAALKLMGIELEDKDKDYGSELSPLYASILIYPSMLNDVHVRKTMKSVLLSLRKQAQGCKLMLDGLWSYICPDLYAFCEWLFLGKDVPEGLIPEGRIYNSYYNQKPEITETCCLRYPHLSDCEHAVKKIYRSHKCDQWFIGYDTIVSSHDLISKAIQADWDGDHICLVHDNTFLDVINKNQYPLYYTMTKAKATDICVKSVMDCLVSSFWGNENIGFVSNAITKIFSSDNPDIKLVRILCAYNNFVIDFFKTQKSMDLQSYKASYEEYKDKNSKFPYFFKYAKDKKAKSCNPYNGNSNCDRISRYISKSTSNGISQIDYDCTEQFNPEVLKDRAVTVKRQSDLYENMRVLLTQLKYERLSMYKRIKSDLDAKESEQRLFSVYCLKKFKEIIPDRRTAASYLVDIEYYTDENASDKKDILWECFGDVLFDNISQSVNCGEITSTKRMIYQSSIRKEELVAECREQVLKEQEELRAVPITKDVFHYLMEVKTRADRKSDKFIMFVLYVLTERFKKKYDKDAEYIRIYKGSKTKGKITCASIDKLIGSECTKKGLLWLQKKGYIKVEECEKYYKVYLLNAPQNDKKRILFHVISYNPLLDLWEYTGDKVIGKCEICGRKFIVSGNAKTCSRSKCSVILRKLNK